MTTQKLREKAYELYPKGIYDGVPEYESTPERRRLREIRKIIPDLTNNWEHLLIDLQKGNILKDLKIEDWSETLPIEQCFKLRIYSAQFPTGGLVLNVSVLIPYYIIHRPSFDRSESRALDFPFDITGKNLDISLLIKPIVERNFPGYEELMSDVALETIEDITFDGVGTLNRYLDQTGLPKMTIFNAFFSVRYL